jgi:hypothetical protein
VAQRVTKAIEKLELILQNGKKSGIKPLLSLLNGEATALNTWHQNNPGVLHLGAQQIKHR